MSALVWLLSQYNMRLNTLEIMYAPSLATNNCFFLKINWVLRLSEGGGTVCQEKNVTFSKRENEKKRRLCTVFGVLPFSRYQSVTLFSRNVFYEVYVWLGSEQQSPKNKTKAIVWNLELDLIVWNLDSKTIFVT